jgi:hypothetical protein
MKLTDFLDADEAAEAPRPLTVTSNSDTLRWENISHDSEGPFDKLDKIADWDDIFVYGANYTKLDRAPDSKTLVAYKRPGAESDYSVKILKDNPHVVVVHSDQCRLPVGGNQKLTKGRVCAEWYHGGNESAAATAMLQGTAGYLPSQIQDAVRAPDKSTYSGQDREPLDDSLPADDPNQDQPEPDPAQVFAEDVEKEARKMRVRDAAQRKIRKENDRDYGNLDPIPLADFLAVEDEPVSYRIDRLWPRHGRIVLAAQAKAGKTTLIGNAMRSLLDGDPFLGKYQTEPIQGGVILLDFEMDDSRVRKWLRDQQIQNVVGGTVKPLRGKASSFDILDPQIRTEWAARIRGDDVAILDCLRPILDALGLDENRDAGRFLTAFDELLNMAGVTEALILHHMGHTGERSRGDSRIIGWPDATWKMFRENPEDENSPRYFSAYGRDVHCAEDELHYNPQHRRLTLTGDGSRKQAQALRLEVAVMKILQSQAWTKRRSS